MKILNIWSAILSMIVFITFIIKKTSNHADDKHGNIVELIRKTYNEKGSFEIWQENIKRNVYHNLVQLEDGRVGDWIMIIDGGKNIEKSVFLPKEGSLTKIHIWLNKKATKL